MNSPVRPPPVPLTLAKARNAAFINQLATPGLGTLLVGRWVLGIGQLAVAVAGFVLVLCWFLLLMVEMYQETANGAPPRSVAWIGELGAALFIGSWVWSLFTSLSLMREARQNEPRMDMSEQ